LVVGCVDGYIHVLVITAEILKKVTDLRVDEGLNIIYCRN
jgi:hypothetical protein